MFSNPASYGSSPSAGTSLLLVNYRVQCGMTRRGYLILVLPSQSVASHKSVAAIKSVAEEYEVKLWQKLAAIKTL
jgi:hypothetical protein